MCKHDNLNPRFDEQRPRYDDPELDAVAEKSGIARSILEENPTAQNIVRLAEIITRRRQIELNKELNQKDHAADAFKFTPVFVKKLSTEETAELCKALKSSRAIVVEHPEGRTCPECMPLPFRAKYKDGEPQSTEEEEFKRFFFSPDGAPFRDNPISNLDGLLGMAQAIERFRRNGEFERAAEPLIKYLAENHHPHVSAYVTSCRAELSEGIKAHHTNDYIRD